MDKKVYETMVNPDNQRVKNENVVFGTINKKTDYHLLERYKIDDRMLIEHIKEKDEFIKAQKKLNDNLKEVIRLLVEENRKIKERLDDYGI